MSKTKLIKQLRNKIQTSGCTDAEITDVMVNLLGRAMWGISDHNMIKYMEIASGIKLSLLHQGIALQQDDHNDIKVDGKGKLINKVSAEPKPTGPEGAIYE